MTSEQIQVAEALLAAQKQGQPAALATVIEVRGSVPRHVGSKMLIYPDGRIVGTVGGGQMEALVIRDAQAAIQGGTSRLVEYNLTDIGAGDPGICGGTVRLFVEALGVAPHLTGYWRGGTWAKPWPNWASGWAGAWCSAMTAPTIAIRRLCPTWMDTWWCHPPNCRNTPPLTSELTSRR
ncbi:MAG: XdhC family protein [Anaerolineae bacterium]|nr:XdhC family protein [Anaerolineae bacterium]